MPELPYWGRDGCVLVGDAAHALPPRSGQGASQALEDAHTLALLLAGYLEKGNTDIAISRSIQGLYDLRSEIVKKIKADASQWREPAMPMSWLKTCGLYVALFLLIKVRNLISFFSREKAWDLKDEVRRYLAQ